MDSKDLFVAEEEDTPAPSTHANEENAQDRYENDHDMDADTNADTNTDANGVHIGDDPIIRSIPIFHGKLPHRQSQSLHVLQYTGRQKTQSFDQQSLKASVKSASKVVQMQIPISTERFYSTSRADELGGHVEAVSLQGVLTETNGGLYAGKIVGGDDDPKIVLYPLDSTAQLRPAFKYMDDLDNARLQQTRQEYAAADPVKSSAVSVLQTASKPGNNPSAEGQFGGGSGSCLRHVKRFNEENWQGLSWFSGSDSATAKVVGAMANPQGGDVETSTVLDEFL